MERGKTLFKRVEVHLTQLDSSILSPQKTWVRSNIIVSNCMTSLKTLALILQMSIMMIVWKVYYLVTFSLEKMTMIMRRDIARDVIQGRIPYI